MLEDLICRFWSQNNESTSRINGQESGCLVEWLFDDEKEADRCYENLMRVCLLGEDLVPNISCDESLLQERLLRRKFMARKFIVAKIKCKENWL